MFQTTQGGALWTGRIDRFRLAFHPLHDPSDPCACSPSVDRMDADAWRAKEARNKGSSEEGVGDDILPCMTGGMSNPVSPCRVHARGRQLPTRFTAIESIHKPLLWLQGVSEEPPNTHTYTHKQHRGGPTFPTDSSLVASIPVPRPWPIGPFCFSPCWRPCCCWSTRPAPSCPRPAPRPRPRNSRPSPGAF